MFLDKILKKNKGGWNPNQDDSKLSKDDKLIKEARRTVSEEKIRRIYPDWDTIVMPNFIRKWNWPFVYTSYYKLERYPLTVDWFWLTELYNSFWWISIDIQIIPVDKDIAREQIKKNISAFKRAAYIDSERGYEDEKLHDVISENEAVAESLSQNNLLQVSINIAISVVIDDEEWIKKILKWDEKDAIDKLVRERDKLHDVIRRARNFGVNTKVVEYAYNQPAWLVGTTPVHINQRATYKDMLSPSACGLFPFTSEIANDQSGGYVMGVNMATWEPFAPNVEQLNRESKVSNIHICAFWMSGKGKSTMITRMVIMELYKKTIILDYAWDYLMVASIFKENSHIKKYSLKWVEEGGYIPDDNFFHIPLKQGSKEPMFTVDEYIANVLLRCFAMFYPKIETSNSQRAILSEAFTILYTPTESGVSKVTRDPTGLNLTIIDLKLALELLLNEARRKPEMKSLEDYTDIIHWLEPCFSWIYKHIFARKWESLQSDKNLIVVDLVQVREIVPLASFIMMYNFILARERFAKEKDIYWRSKRIVCDEFHRVSTNGLILQTFSRAFKEARWEGIQLIVGTQSVWDLLENNDGKEIINNSWITVFFWQSQHAIWVIKEKLPWKLSDRALSFLEEDKVWEAVVSLGTKDFICSFIAWMFFNRDLYKKNIVLKSKYWPDGFFDFDEINRNFGGAYDEYKAFVKKGFELQEKIRDSKKEV